MSYKSILVLLDYTKSSQARAEAAIGLAIHHGAHLTALYVIVDPSSAIYVHGYLPRDVLKTARAQEEALANDVMNRFAAAAERHQVLFDKRIERGLDYAVPDIISMHARYADLIVVGQTEPDDPPPIPGLPGQLVLACGCPILMVPYVGPAATLGERVAVAWDASREASRAVRDALPILTQAKSVSVIVVNPDQRSLGHGDVPGADIAAHLARHGLKVNVQRVDNPSLDVGNALLSHLACENADLLVMGGYGHSRLREIILGGATRTMLHEMTGPVLMSH